MPGGRCLQGQILGLSAALDPVQSRTGGVGLQCRDAFPFLQCRVKHNILRRHFRGGIKYQRFSHLIGIRSQQAAVCQITEGSRNKDRELGFYRKVRLAQVKADNHLFMIAVDSVISDTFPIGFHKGSRPFRYLKDLYRIGTERKIAQARSHFRSFHIDNHVRKFFLTAAVDKTQLVRRGALGFVFAVSAALCPDRFITGIVDDHIIIACR